ncbi:hypothetical protein TVAG_254520 [Trichomonas vaginalis G3]|uniref:Uncharacterized protein n=1 Tax=Trichomonas vaginalis (strain ATCC PRA-98 / G3) TaxID=412133 RepID=A2DMW9_TRIV3|nr:hypothetical protein TVAG_254520 [Trichomonas vaginalis G3]|eukprot:XP_001579326.1 hypothetical protein [Trichomonas vaginalis G3]
MSFSPNISQSIQEQSFKTLEELQKITFNNQRLEQLAIEYLSFLKSSDAINVDIKAINNKIAEHGVDLAFLNKISNIRNFAFKLGQICKIPYYNGLKQKTLTYKFFEIFWGVIEPHIKEAYEQAKLDNVS